MTHTQRRGSRTWLTLTVAFSLIISGVVPLIDMNAAHATSLTSETFNGISTPANAWISGGAGGSVACLTGATTSASNSIPACSGGPIDATPGTGVLRLTPRLGNRSGFAIYNTPVSADHGLNIAFDMFQYNGNGADGISFFLIDGSASPTQPGASGGSLGYASGSNGETPGIVGGYVGVGFDRFGNFSNSDVGSGGPGAVANNIGVRGSEDSGYQYVTGKVAAGNLANTGTTVRANAKRHVVIFVSTNNVMTVSVDYNDGQGLRTELSNIDLNTINGPGSLPASFKFGFAASTGGSYDIHEISGLTVNTLNPIVGVAVTHGGTFIQGGTAGYYNMTVSNNAGGETATGTISVQSTAPAGLTPTAASGTGWSCGIVGQVVTCTRSDTLAPGASEPVIKVDVSVASNAATSVIVPASVTMANNDNPTPSTTHSIAITAGSSGDADGVFNAEEDGAPHAGDANNDGTADSLQSNVSSFHNPVTGNYSVLQSSGGCTGNTGVSAIDPSNNTVVDGAYSYPAGMINFSLTCGAPGNTATVTQYYYGSFTPADLVMRKYNSTTHTYSVLSDAVLSNVTIGGQSALKAVYSIQDGGPLDQDGLANGVIVDPAGPALLAVVPTPTPSPSATATPSADPTATPEVLAASVPDTGLPYSSPWKYIAAIALGVSVLGYELRRIYLAKKA